MLTHCAARSSAGHSSSISDSSPVCSRYAPASTTNNGVVSTPP
ncbi:hypothetical protein BURPSS13_C0004 [Burkholderia pseudomallei S13]|nr:hypothetical protein BURPSS13_C0004 [Burkholderia pseudomallei S13]